MQYRKVSITGLEISIFALGTWAFGSDKWWGYQDDKKSYAVLEEAAGKGVNIIDTAPVYGRGHSEKIVGAFLREKNLREKVILATKLGLNWGEGPKIYCDSSKKRMLEELDLSRKRLDTDYIDIYQVHWPDPDTPIAETAQVMHDFYKKGIIKAVGVSNYDVAQMQEFMRNCPLHTLQPPYNMFRREIEKDIIPFCKENNIATLAYIPLHSGILTGKFFLDNVPIPNDLCRKNHADLKEPLFSINKEILAQMKDIAAKYGKTLTQLVLNWTMHQDGISSVLVGARNTKQLNDDLGSIGWDIEKSNLEKIEELLKLRKEKIQAQTKP